MISRTKIKLLQWQFIGVIERNNRLSLQRSTRKRTVIKRWKESVTVSACSLCCESERSKQSAIHGNLKRKRLTAIHAILFFDVCEIGENTREICLYKSTKETNSLNGFKPLIIPPPPPHLLQGKIMKTRTESKAFWEILRRKVWYACLWRKQQQLKGIFWEICPFT